MKQTINVSEFRDAFRRMDRNNFSYEALGMLFEYFENLEEDTGEEMELDVIAICCDYNEDSPEDIADNYSIDLSELDEDDDVGKENAVMDYLNDHTSVIGQTSSGTIIYQVF